MDPRRRAFRARACVDSPASSGSHQPTSSGEGGIASLADGHLPYANSQILPVGAYGMQPRWGLEPPVRQFAEDNQVAYEEVDRYGQIAMSWARRVAVRGRDLLPPHIPAAELDGEDSQETGGQPAVRE